jgi:hypothetical protein
LTQGSTIVSYWSSSERSRSGAWSQSFISGYISGKYKSSTDLVRAVRAIGDTQVPINEPPLEPGDIQVPINEPPLEPGVPQGTYTIGDTGPAGGIVFYLNDDGSSGMEVAREYSGTSGWGCDGLKGATGTAIGTGQSNTDAIIRKCRTPFSAAKLARSYLWPNGQTDGFLPSRSELDAMYLNKDKVGGFGARHWSSSSSQENDEHAWFMTRTGSQGIGSKQHRYIVRAVRAF